MYFEQMAEFQRWSLREAVMALGLNLRGAARTVLLSLTLTKVQDGKERVIAYGSCTVTKEEQRYFVTQRELLAIVHFVKQYCHYLYGKKFVIRTDQSALQRLMRFKDPQGQVARWLEVLVTYNYVIKHMLRLKQGNTDFLSLGSCRQCGKEDRDGSLAEMERTMKVVTRKHVRRCTIHSRTSWGSSSTGSTGP